MDDSEALPPSAKIGVVKRSGFGRQLEPHDMTDARQLRRSLDYSSGLYRTGFYHSFRLPNGSEIKGSMPVELLESRYALFPLPENLADKTLLDIGAWDGWFSFEAERRGAVVTAIDTVDIPNFRAMQSLLNSQVTYKILDVYELPKSGLSSFDYVFFLGVLYHVKHPLLALELVCGLTKDVCIVDSFVVDADTWQDHTNQIPWFEYYETDELGGHLDNWFGPSVSALIALCRTAGFARVELLRAGEHRAVLACFRKWPELLGAATPGPQLDAVVNNATGGINLSSTRDEYLVWYFRAPVEDILRDDLMLEVAGFGVPTLFIKQMSEHAWMASSRLPPALSPGWKSVSLRLRDSDATNQRRIAVDIPLPVTVSSLSLRAVYDGRTWEPDVLRLAAEAPIITFWAQGLPENADRVSVNVYLGSIRLKTAFVGDADLEGWRQINAELNFCPRSSHERLSFSFADVSSQGAEIALLRPE